MRFFSAVRRRPRSLSQWRPEVLEDRALLSAMACDVKNSGVSADVGAVTPGSRHGIPKISVAGDDYSLSSDQLGNGSLVITQEGNNIHGVFTASLVQSATFDASFKKDTAKVANGTLTALFTGDDAPVQAKFKVKFKVDKHDGGISYTFNHLKFTPAPV